MARSKRLQKNLQKLSGTRKSALVVLGDFGSISEIQGIGNPPDGAIATVSNSAALYTYDADSDTWTLSAGGSGIAEVAADATPQLGGDLDLNTNNIIGSGVINITGLITGNGFSTTGNVTVGGTVDGRDIATDGTKLDTIETNADVTDETNVLAALDGATIPDAGTPAAGDKVLIQDVSDSDNLKYVNISDLPSGGGGGGGSGISNIVEDTTPQLGGTLDLNGNTVGAASAADLTKLSELTATSTELNYVDGVTSNIQTQLDSKTTVSSGAGAPGSTPSNVGDIYVDTTDDIIYVATGTASSADWQEQVIVDGTSLSDGELLIWDAGNSKFVRDNRTTGTTAVTTIDMNSIMGNFYSTTTASTASSYTLQNVLAGGKATVRIQEATAGGPTFSGTGLTITKKGDWTNDYDTTNVNVIYFEAVTSTLIWAFIAAVEA